MTWTSQYGITVPQCKNILYIVTVIKNLIFLSYEKNGIKTFSFFSKMTNRYKNLAKIHPVDYGKHDQHNFASKQPTRWQNHLGKNNTNIAVT